MRLRVLGPIEVDCDAVLGPRDRVVLAALALRPGDALSAEVLADTLWSSRPPVSWAKVVQGCISRLRRLLGRDAIDTTPAGYRLVAARVPLDRDEFESLLGRGREYAATGAPERESPQEGWLRPDGRTVAVNGRLGVAVWDLDPAVMAAAACRVAGRNLTRAEWATYMGEQRYRRTCPAYPEGD